MNEKEIYKKVEDAAIFSLNKTLEEARKNPNDDFKHGAIFAVVNFAFLANLPLNRLEQGLTEKNIEEINRRLKLLEVVNYD